jgi:NMD protein affecting ribosome stability and mRNA decay
MKQTNIPPQGPAEGRRIAGRAQRDHILDPYERQRKFHEGTVCPQCSAVYRAGRWQWLTATPGSVEELCAACRRINDHYPAGVVTLRGRFAIEQKEELLRLARHQEAAEKQEHPMNRIMSIEDEVNAVVINTTDIHLPRRIGEAVQRAFHGELSEHFDHEGYFARVNWLREA